MQISDLINQLNQQTVNGQGTGVKSATQEYADPSRTLLGLKEGEVFEGTVMDVENGKVTISLANGSSILARLDSGVSLTQGLATFFQVKSNQGGQIALKAVTQDNFANPTLLKALNQAGVQVSTRNLDLIKAMMDQQLPIDTKSVLSMVRAANAFPSANVTTLTQLQKLSLPINELNIEQLEQYNRGEGQIASNLNEIMKALPQLIGQAKGQTEGLAMAKQILSLFAGEGAELPATNKQETSGAVFGESGPEASQNAGGGQTTPGTGTLQNGGETMNLLQGEAEGVLNGTTPDAAEEIHVGADSEIAGGGRTGAERENAGGIHVGAEEAAGGIPGGTGEEAVGGIHAGEKQAAELMQAGEQTITDMGTNSSAQMEMSGQNTELTEKLKQVLEWLSEGNVSKEEVSELFGRRDFQELLQNAVKKQWFLEPGEVADKEKLEKLYERIDRQMSRLQEIFTQAGHKDSPLVRQMADTRSNLSFLNQINQFYNYVQIPLRMANQNATGDLYVYTNRKNFSKNREELSAHLHLEMEHLGITDVFVKLNQKKLSTNFVMEDERSLDLVMEHIDILTDRLQKKGYEVDIKVKENPNKEQQAMFVQELLGQQTAQPQVVSRYSFDVKV